MQRNNFFSHRQDDVGSNEIAHSDAFRKYQQFKLEIEIFLDEQGEWPSGEVRNEIGKKLYFYTREFLEANQDKISPIEKGVILNFYIALWVKGKCKLSLKNTEYAAEDKRGYFGNYCSSYCEDLPMFSGFNLQKAKIKGRMIDFVFINVNFSEADLSQADFSYSHFENCDLSFVKAHRASFNQCRFIKCDFTAADLRSSFFCSANFVNSRCQNTNFKKSDFSSSPFFEKCNVYNTIFDEDVYSGKYTHNHVNFRNCFDQTSLRAEIEIKKAIFDFFQNLRVLPASFLLENAKEDLTKNQFSL